MLSQTQRDDYAKNDEDDDEDDVFLENTFNMFQFFAYVMCLRAEFP